MPLNPNGYTYKELADLIKKTNRGLYGSFDDKDLVEHFKKQLPDMFSEVGGWDKIINEPTFTERLAKPWDALGTRTEAYGTDTVKEFFSGTGQRIKESIVGSPFEEQEPGKTYMEMTILLLKQDFGMLLQNYLKLKIKKTYTSHLVHCMLLEVNFIKI